MCGGCAKWDPSTGHVPRGFVGALDRLEDVRVVLLLGEPGPPYSREQYGDGADLLEETCQHTFACLDRPDDQMHKNLRYVLDQIFPGFILRDQLRSAWITETYLCSPPTALASVDASCERECADRYLGKQLQLFRHLPVIALGGKAQSRVKRTRVEVPNLINAWSVSPPGANRPKARESWTKAADEVRTWM